MSSWYETLLTTEPKVPTIDHLDHSSRHDHLTVIGFSCRALAQCARREGFSPKVFDSCGDRDTRSLASQFEHLDLSHSRWTTSVAHGGRIVMAGGLEDQSATLRDLRVMDPSIHADLVAKMRSLINWQSLAEKAEIRFPKTILGPFKQTDSLDSSASWLLKKRTSSGGLGVSRHQGTMDVASSDSNYFQEWIQGESIGVTFLSTNRGTTPMGITRSVQLEPNPWSDFIYRGSFGPFRCERDIWMQLARFGNTVAGDLGWIGIWQADMILNDQGLYLLEINPRWTASMEILEFSWNLPLVSWHLGASFCSHETWNAILELVSTCHEANAPLIWKQIIYAPDSFQPSKELLDAWWEKRWIDAPADVAGTWVADIPNDESEIPFGAPVCSLLNRSTAIDSLESIARLARREIESQIATCVKNRQT